MEVILGVDERELEKLRTQFDAVSEAQNRGLLLDEFMKMMSKWISRDEGEDPSA